MCSRFFLAFLVACAEAFTSIPRPEPRPWRPDQANPCKVPGAPDEDPVPVAAELHDRPCTDPTVGPQAGADVTVGAKGLKESDMDPLTPSISVKDWGACPVNVHWHMGTEHYNNGTYDMSMPKFVDWLAKQRIPGIADRDLGIEDDALTAIVESYLDSLESGDTDQMLHALLDYRKRLHELCVTAVDPDPACPVLTEEEVEDARKFFDDAQVVLEHIAGKPYTASDDDDDGDDGDDAHETSPGIMCHNFEPALPMFHRPYEWKHCSYMVVGLTYEVHWPHSSYGACDTKWQYQSPFPDGVFCKATEQGWGAAKIGPELVGDDNNDPTAAIGVFAQMFTVVNPTEEETDEFDYDIDYSDWDMLSGWNWELAIKDFTGYVGSTTGASANNDGTCRGTGGLVHWHVDRGCHFISAKAFDRLCEQMLEVGAKGGDDMTADVSPHGARQLVIPQLVHDLKHEKFDLD